MPQKKSNNLKCHAVVLNRNNYKDADKILTLYTKELGKISVIAKGIRKLTSHKRGRLEILNVVKCEIISYYDFYIITQTDLIKDYNICKKSFEKLNMAYFMIEVFDKFVPQHVEDQNLFAFLIKTLDYLNLEEASELLIGNIFIVKLLRLTGFWDEGFLKDFSHDEGEMLKAFGEKKYEELVVDGTAALRAAVPIQYPFHIKLKSLTEEILEQKIRTTILYPN